uniref:Uncharacterized protein n=1 Tax=Cacopsylla melanoneura TaxID=428564 RepID=A0A8D8UFH7_9HEMI
MIQRNSTFKGILKGVNQAMYESNERFNGFLYYIDTNFSIETPKYLCSRKSNSGNQLKTISKKNLGLGLGGCFSCRAAIFFGGYVGNRFRGRGLSRDVRCT